jgi:RHS repeat-associated protein
MDFDYTIDASNRLTNVTYADGTNQAYTYDANGNRLTLIVNGGTTVIYTYNDADQLTSDGTSSYAYDANGNLVARGADSFTWDYASRMTGATVGSTTATYTYDGEDVRVGKTVASTPTTYLWDRECDAYGCGACPGGRCGDACGSEAHTGVELLVDDGTNAYLHADGLLAELASSSRLEHLTDGLGSSRGLVGSAPTPAGSADFDVFGAIRSTSGTVSVFRFTGEQHEPESGLTYLRARYYDPAIGRFSSADTVRPNAPGTQGYNLYAYVANNPTTWIDPTGHAAVTAGGMSRAIPSARSAFAGFEYVAALGVAVAAAPHLQGLGQRLAGVFEYIALMLNPYTRDLINTISRSTREAYCWARWEAELAKCSAWAAGMAIKCGWGPKATAQAYNHCKTIAGDRARACPSYGYLNKLPWQRGYHGIYEGGQCGEPSTR